MVDTNIILNSFFDSHEKPSIIAKKLNVNPSYVTKIIKKDKRYIKEKEYRNNISKENRKISKRNWIRKRREEEKRLSSFVKEQHNEASEELSFNSVLSDDVYRKWNSSAYHTTKSGNIVIDRKLNVGSDVPKRININVKIPTQKFKKRYCFSR